MDVWLASSTESDESIAERKLREGIELNGLLASTALNAAGGDRDRAVSILEMAIMTLMSEHQPDMGRWDG